jgi:ABC-type multidrug transport system ATPase subunit
MNFQELHRSIKNNLSITETNHYYYKEFKYIHALKDFDFLFNLGTIYGLIGPSGCGKSTLGNVISGRLKPSSGIIRFGNFPIDSGGDRFEIGKRVQVISQNAADSLNQYRTGWSLLRDVATYESILPLIDAFNLSIDLLSQQVYSYSGGEKQRLHLLRTWLVNSSILILDESFSALDAETKDNISKLIRKEQHNRIIIFITHDLSVMLELCNELLFMFDGKLISHMITFDETLIYNTFADYDELRMELRRELNRIRLVKKTNLFHHLLNLLKPDN